MQFFIRVLCPSILPLRTFVIKREPRILDSSFRANSAWSVLAPPWMRDPVAMNRSLTGLNFSGTTWRFPVLYRNFPRCRGYDSIKVRTRWLIKQERFLTPKLAWMLNSLQRWQPTSQVSRATFDLPDESSTESTEHSTCSSLQTRLPGDLRHSRYSTSVRHTTPIVIGEHLRRPWTAYLVIRDQSSKRGSICWCSVFGSTPQQICSLPICSWSEIRAPTPV